VQTGNPGLETLHKSKTGLHSIGIRLKPSLIFTATTLTNERLETSHCIALVESI
jgi:hypothetical protein